MTPEMRIRARNIAVYILCSLMLVIAGSTLIREKSYHDDYPYLRIGGDAALYKAMTEETEVEIPAPFRYRLLFPFLASLFDLPAVDAFRWITLVSLFLFYCIGFLLCELRHCDPAATIMSMLFVFLSPWHLYMYQNPFITDGAVQLTIMILLFSVLQKKFWLFCIAALAGIFLHERILFFLPLWMIVHNVRSGSIVAGVIGLAYVGLRLIVGSTGGSFVDDPVGQLSVFVHPLEMIKDAVAGSLLLYVVAVTGFLAQTPEAQRRTRPILILFLAASVIPALVATDTGRMLLGLAPLAVVLSASFFSTVRFSPWGIAIIILTAAAGFAYLPVTFLPISDWLVYRKPVMAVSLSLFVLCYAVFMRRRGGRLLSAENGKNF